MSENKSLKQVHDEGIALLSEVQIELVHIEEPQRPSDYIPQQWYSDKLMLLEDRLCDLISEHRKQKLHVAKTLTTLCDVNTKSYDLVQARIDGRILLRGLDVLDAT